MILIILAALVVLVTLVLATIKELRTLGSAGQSLPVTAEWIDELSTERYRPMVRLLDTGDIDFLRSQPGFTRKMESAMRAQRCRVFRGYLNCLEADFERVCMALKLVLAQSAQDRPDLAAVLVHHQIMFIYGVLAIYCRLFLYRWGICTVNVASLVRIFDAMRIELRSLVPSATQSCA